MQNPHNDAIKPGGPSRILDARTLESIEDTRKRMQRFHSINHDINFPDDSHFKPWPERVEALEKPLEELMREIDYFLKNSQVNDSQLENWLGTDLKSRKLLIPRESGSALQDFTTWYNNMAKPKIRQLFEDLRKLGGRDDLFGRISQFVQTGTTGIEEREAIMSTSWSALYLYFTDLRTMRDTMRTCLFQKGAIPENYQQLLAAQASSSMDLYYHPSPVEETSKQQKSAPKVLPNDRGQKWKKE
jgi:hypothetical protein